MTEPSMDMGTGTGMSMQLQQQQQQPSTYMDTYLGLAAHSAPSNLHPAASAAARHSHSLSHSRSNLTSTAGLYQGISRSLQRLGLGQLLGLYLHGVRASSASCCCPSGSFGVGGQLLEYLHESAWRECKWNDSVYDVYDGGSNASMPNGVGMGMGMGMGMGGMGVGSALRIPTPAPLQTHMAMAMQTQANGASSADTQWDVQGAQGEDSFHQSIYTCLQAMRLHDRSKFTFELEKTRRQVAAEMGRRYGAGMGVRRGHCSVRV